MLNCTDADAMLATPTTAATFAAACAGYPTGIPASGDKRPLFCKNGGKPNLNLKMSSPKFRKKIPEKIYSKKTYRC